MMDLWLLSLSWLSVHSWLHLCCNFLFTIYKIRLWSVICSIFLWTTGFLNWVSGRIVPNSRVDIRLNLCSEIATVLSSLSSFFIQAQKEFSKMCQFSIQKLKAVLLNAYLPGSRVDAQLTARQLCLTKTFYFARLCPLPPCTASSAAASVPLSNCTHDLWMRGKLRWKCFWSCTSAERDKIFEVWWGGKGCAQKRVWCTASQLRCSCMPESSLGGETNGD